MNYYIGIQDLVSNALIELFECEKRTSITFQEVCAYGEAVVRIMNEDKMNAYLVLSRYQTDGFIRDCSDILEVVDGNTFELKSKNGSGIDALKARFRDETPFDVLMACISPESLKALNINAA